MNRTITSLLAVGLLTTVPVLGACSNNEKAASSASTAMTSAGGAMETSGSSASAAMTSAGDAMETAKSSASDAMTSAGSSASSEVAGGGMSPDGGDPKDLKMKCSEYNGLDEAKKKEAASAVLAGIDPKAASAAGADMFKPSLDKVCAMPDNQDKTLADVARTIKAAAPSATK